MNVYLIQSTDCLKPYAIQNAIVVARDRNTAIKKFSKELQKAMKNYNYVEKVNAHLVVED